MAKDKNAVIRHRYLLVPLTSLMQHPHLKYMIWPADPDSWASMATLLYNYYAVSEKHENISIIPVYIDEPEWREFTGDPILVRPMV